MSYYAYYNEKFEVTMISNELDNTTHDMFIIIDEVMFLAFAEEKINYSNYAVIGGKLTLKAELELEKYTDSRIPVTLTDEVFENCLMVTQDKKNKHWFAQCYVSTEVIENFVLLPKEHIEKKIFTFYVVSKDNRFILLDTLTVPAKNILTKTDGWKQRGLRDNEDVEVFTSPAYTIADFDTTVVTQDVRLLCRRDFLTYHHKVGELA
jgi:hypothetical protein